MCICYNTLYEQLICETLTCILKLNTVYIVHCTQYSEQLIVHNIMCTLKTVKYTLKDIEKLFFNIFCIYTFKVWTLRRSWKKEERVYTVKHKLYTINWTLYTVHCTLYTVYFTLSSKQCPQYTLHTTLFIVHCTLYIVHSTMCTVLCTLYTVHYPSIHHPYVSPISRQTHGLAVIYLSLTLWPSDAQIKPYL